MSGQRQARDIGFAAAETSMVLVTIDSPNLSLGPQWDDLVRRASSNVFMNPVALKAASETGFADLRMLLAWESGAANRRLVGVWAMQLRKLAPLWPTFLEALPYEYAFLSSPVIDPAFVDQVIPAFFAAVQGEASLPNVLSMRAFDTECPSYAATLRVLRTRGIEPVIHSQHARPFVTRESGVKRQGSTRKKLRQDWNRLAGLGTVEVVNDRSPQAVAEAFEQFLALEQRSWKGRRGTALLSNPADAIFVRRLLAALAARGEASVALLKVNGQAIAAQVLMYGGSTAYTWKTAFDADFAKYSPGTLLVDRMTEMLFAGLDIFAINSCSAETGFMAQLWAGRRGMADLLIDLGPTKSLQFRLEAARQLGYDRLRNLRHQWAGWRPGTPAKKLAPVANRA